MEYTTQTYQQLDKALFQEGVEERVAFFMLLKEYGSLFPNYSQQARGVDLGSVTGFYPLVLSQLGLCAYAVNSDQKAVQYLREEATYSPNITESVDVLQADMLALPFESGSVDLLTCMTGTLSHLSPRDQRTILSENSRVLRKDGALFLSDWNLALPEQDFFGVYSLEQQQELRKNHWGYPYVQEWLSQVNIASYKTCLHSGKRLYTILGIKQ